MKIKTNARLKECVDSLDQRIADEIDSNRSGRNTRNRTEAQIYQYDKSIDDNTPIPGTANYELYRTLTSSPISHQQQQQYHSQNLQSTNALEHPNNNSTLSQYQNSKSDQNDLIHQTTDIDNVSLEASAERGIVPKKRRGRNKAKIESNNSEAIAVEEPIVQKKQRNRRKNGDIPSETTIDTQQLNVDTQLQSPQLIEEKLPKKRITAAAKKQYKDTEHFNAVEPNPIELQPMQSAADATDEVNSEIVTSSRGRGRKAKAKVAPISTIKSNQLPQDETNYSTQRSTRATRHNTNGNMMQVISVNQ